MEPQFFRQPRPTEEEMKDRLQRIHPELGGFLTTHTFQEYFDSLRKDRDLNRGTTDFQELESRVSECYRIALGEPMRGLPQW